nr:prephenate dehydratase domain-containing protein [Candidatus Brachybacter algidus]
MNNPILNNHTPIKKIAIQGYEGSFHQEAALNFFGEHISILPCDNFPEVFKVAG